MKKTTSKKKEAKLWRKVAEEISDNIESRFPYHGGICSYVSNVAWRHKEYGRMIDRIYGHMKVHKNRIPLAGYGNEFPEMCFAYPEGKQMEARLLAALWMELEAKEGYDA